MIGTAADGDLDALSYFYWPASWGSDGMDEGVFVNVECREASALDMTSMEQEASRCGPAPVLQGLHRPRRFRAAFLAGRRSSHRSAAYFQIDRAGAGQHFQTLLGHQPRAAQDDTVA